MCECEVDKIYLIKENGRLNDQLKNIIGDYYFIECSCGKTPEKIK